MQSPFYIASVILLKLHGCVVSHMQVLATTLLSVHNIELSSYNIDINHEDLRCDIVYVPEASEEEAKKIFHQSFFSDEVYIR